MMNSCISDLKVVIYRRADISKIQCNDVFLVHAAGCFILTNDLLFNKCLLPF